MFEIAKILFIITLTLAAMMLPKEVRELQDEFARRRGDTTEVYLHNVYWKEKFSEQVTVYADSVKSLSRRRKKIERERLYNERKQDVYIKDILLVPRTREDSLRRLAMD